MLSIARLALFYRLQIMVINISSLPWKSLQPRKGENFRRDCDIRRVNTGSNEYRGKNALILPGKVSGRWKTLAPHQLDRTRLLYYNERGKCGKNGQTFCKSLLKEMGNQENRCSFFFKHVA